MSSGISTKSNNSTIPFLPPPPPPVDSVPLMSSDTQVGFSESLTGSSNTSFPSTVFSRGVASAFSPLNSTSGAGSHNLLSSSSFSPFTPVVRTVAPAASLLPSSTTSDVVSSASNSVVFSLSGLDLNTPTSAATGDTELSSGLLRAAPPSPTTGSETSATSAESTASASTASTPITSSGTRHNRQQLCTVCGQWHALNSIHLYDYSEPVDAVLLCKLCKQPLVNPLDTKCGHTFCTPCLKNRLAVNALCPVDGEIINFLECQQSTNLVKKLLDRLLVICPNRDYCEEALLARCDLEEHLRHHCRGTVVPCVNAHTGKCNFMAPRIAHAVHLHECPAGPGGPMRTALLRGLRDKGDYSERRPSVPSSGTLTHANSTAGSETHAGYGDTSGDNAMIHVRSSGDLPSLAPFSCAASIQEGVPQLVKLFRGENCDLGISIVGGCDTPLNCIVIQSIYLDGVVARDGRLRPGDQILAVNEFDLRDATHAQAKRELSKLCTYCSLSVFREKVVPPRLMKSSKEEQVSVTLTKRADNILGIKIAGKKNKPGLYVMELVKDAIADLDGRLQKDDRILEINNHDLRNGTQDDVLPLIQGTGDQVTFVVSRRLRASTPDILRSGGGSDSPMPSPAQSHPLMAPQAQHPLLLNPMPMRGMMETGRSMVIGGGPLAGSPVQVVDVVVNKDANESLGMSVAGGLHSQRGHTPVYVTNLHPDGVLARTKMVKKGDILLSINAMDLLGLTHDAAVLALKQEASGKNRVILRLLEGPETSSGAGNFMPSWSYWLQLPALCHTPQLVTLRRDHNTGSLGFSIIGGSDCCVQTESGRPSYRPQPIVVKTIVPNTPADADGGLKCGDVIQSVNDVSFAFIEHMEAVKLLKQCGPEVHLQVVSWPGTIV